MSYKHLKIKFYVSPYYELFTTALLSRSVRFYLACVPLQVDPYLHDETKMYFMRVGSVLRTETEDFKSGRLSPALRTGTHFFKEIRSKVSLAQSA